MKPQWKKCDQRRLPYINEEDFWVYAREYARGKGYQGGPTNSLILNFKKPPSAKKDTVEWQYREDAVKKFTEDIEILLGSITRVVLTAIPSSKKKDDSKYNNRFEDLFTEILKAHPQWIVEWPIEIKESITPSHLSSEKDPDILSKTTFGKDLNIQNLKYCIFLTML